MNAASVADPGKVVPLVGGQQQCPGQRGQHLPRRLRAAALLQPDVVVDGHPGQLGDLLAAQPGVPRGHAGPPGPQERRQLGAVHHGHSIQACHLPEPAGWYRQSQARLVSPAPGAAPLAMPASAQYPSSKAALNMLTAMYAKELRDTPVKVNAANPGYTATDFNDHRGFRPATEGAEPSVYLATLPDDGPSGILWGHLWTTGGDGGYGRLDW